MIKPTNEIIESYLFPTSNSAVLTVPGSGQSRRSLTKCQTYGTRISRCLVVIAAAISGIILAKDMDRFLGLMGALLGSPMAMTFPALIHYRLIATTRWEKVIDIFIIFLSGICIVFSTAMSLQAWIAAASLD